MFSARSQAPDDLTCEGRYRREAGAALDIQPVTRRARHEQIAESLRAAGMLPA